MVGSPIILWQIPCSAQKKKRFWVPPARLCVDLSHILCWLRAAHAASSFNVMHSSSPSPQLFKIKGGELSMKEPKQSTWFPLRPLLTISTSHTDLHLFICPRRTAPLCSSVPTSWTRKTSSASQTLSWSSTEVTRMERESVAPLGLFLELQVFWDENLSLNEGSRCWGAEPKVRLNLSLQERSSDNKVCFF